MISVHLVGIHRCDFRKNEVTNYSAACISLFLQKKRLGSNDVVLLISTTSNQMIFCWQPIFVNGRPCYRSLRLRLPEGCWDMLALQDYAKQIGLHLVGLKSLAEHLK